MENEEETKENIKSIKCYLSHCIKEKYRASFLNEVQILTKVSSLMLRRASLLMNFHIKRLLEENIEIPDFFNERANKLLVYNDTFYKYILTLGLKDYKNKFVYNDLEDSYNILQEKELLEKEFEVKLDDQLLCYNAKLFKTVFANNLYIPFETRLIGFCKKLIKLYNEKDDEISKLDILNCIKNNNSSSINNKNIKDHIDNIIEILKEPIINVKSLSINKIYKLYYYIGLFLRDNEFKNNITLFPVFSVSRKHIRLDTRLLLNIMEKIDKKLIFNKKILTIEKFIKDELKCKCPNMFDEDEYFNKKAYKEAEDNYKILKTKISKTDKKYFDEEAYEKAVEKWKSIKKDNYFDKNRFDNELLKWKKNNKMKKPLKKDFINIEQFNNEKGKKPTKTSFIDIEKFNKDLKKPNKNNFINKEKYENDLLIYNEKLDKLKNTTKYKEVEKNYNNYIKSREEHVFHIFNINMKNKSTSINTDGVSVTFQVKKNIIKQNKKSKEKKDKEKILSEEEWYKLTEEQKYLLEDKIVVGLDPGRVSLATLAMKYKSKDGTIKTKSWSLKRRQYYNDILHNKITTEKRKLFRNTFVTYNDEKVSLETYFSTYIGKINSINSNETINYIENYNKIKDVWWNIELQPIQSINKMKVYGKKAKVLTKFFSSVKKEIEELTNNKNIEIAYGCCGTSMNVTGKGEMSVPTTSTYKYCKDVFKKVYLTNEDNSTCVCHRCCNKKLKVYTDDNLNIKYTKSKYLPFVKDEEKYYENNIHHYDKLIENASLREKKRKIKQKELFIKRFESKKEWSVKQNKKTRLPEVRGLRFCKNCRKFFDRDIEAAISISVFHVLKQRELGKAFWNCRKKQSLEKETVNERQNTLCVASSSSC